jgi:hypothetical protein
LRNPDSRWYDDEDYLMDLVAEALRPGRPSEEDVQVADRGACPEPDSADESEDDESTSQTD